MGTCELCGIERKTRQVKEEGAIIEACYNCVQDTSKNVNIRTIKKFRSSSMRTDIPKKTYELADNYGLIIRKSRESMGLTIDELAKRLNISSGYFHKIEKEEIKPDERTIKIIEKTINKSLTIAIIEPDSEEDQDNTEQKRDNGNLTLGDLIKGKLKGFNIK